MQRHLLALHVAGDGKYSHWKTYWLQYNSIINLCTLFLAHHLTHTHRTINSIILNRLSVPMPHNSISWKQYINVHLACHLLCDNRMPMKKQNTIQCHSGMTFLHAFRAICNVRAHLVTTSISVKWRQSVHCDLHHAFSACSLLRHNSTCLQWDRKLHLFIKYLLNVCNTNNIKCVWRTNRHLLV